jgi:hypothetical protein
MIKYLAFAFATIHEQPLQLPYYCRNGNLLHVASVAQTATWIVCNFRITQMQQPFYSAVWVCSFDIDILFVFNRSTYKDK